MTLTHYLSFSSFNDIYLYQKLTKKKNIAKFLSLLNTKKNYVKQIINKVYYKSDKYIASKRPKK